MTWGVPCVAEHCVYGVCVVENLELWASFSRRSNILLALPKNRKGNLKKKHYHLKANLNKKQNIPDVALLGLSKTKHFNLCFNRKGKYYKLYFYRFFVRKKFLLYFVKILSVLSKSLDKFFLKDKK